MSFSPIRRHRDRQIQRRGTETLFSPSIRSQQRLEPKSRPRAPCRRSVEPVLSKNTNEL